MFSDPILVKPYFSEDTVTLVEKLCCEQPLLKSCRSLWLVQTIRAYDEEIIKCLLRSFRQEAHFVCVKLVGIFLFDLIGLVFISVRL